MHKRSPPPIYYIYYTYNVYKHMMLIQNLDIYSLIFSGRIYTDVGRKLPTLVLKIAFIEILAAL